MMNRIYPRSHDKQIVYLKDVITESNIEVGDYTIYNEEQCALPLSGKW